jgi:probable phosphoglycerate mutase
MQLVLARHGNTFESGQPAYYVGSQQDLPLIAFGHVQAALLGQALAQHCPDLKAMYTGPLKRMITTAQLALEAMNSPLCGHIDSRLNELDYGVWSGLTSQEVKDRFGAADYENWERLSQWPTQARWGETEAGVIARIQSFVADLVSRHAEHEQVCVVASNGCLRYFLTIVPGAFEHYVAQQQLKIATGYVCQFSYHQGQWTLDAWNQSPTAWLKRP